MNLTNQRIALILTLVYIILSLIFYSNKDQSQQTSFNNQQSAIRSQKSETGSQKLEILSQTSDLKPQTSDLKFSDIEQNKINQKMPEIINPPLEININEDKVFTVVEENPSFPGGETARMNFLRKNIIYPPDAIKKHIEGKVTINFIIEKDGSVSNIKVLQGIGSGCDEEAVRVVKMMPKWKPGRQSGGPVRVLFNMPINFQLTYAKK